MKRWRDTPPRYIYRDMAGLTAIAALRIIQCLRRAYPTSTELHAELEREREYFAGALRRENGGRKWTFVETETPIRDMLENPRPYVCYCSRAYLDAIDRAFENPAAIEKFFADHGRHA